MDSEWTEDVDHQRGRCKLVSSLTLSLAIVINGAINTAEKLDWKLFVLRTTHVGKSQQIQKSQRIRYNSEIEKI